MKTSGFRRSITIRPTPQNLQTGYGAQVLIVKPEYFPHASFASDYVAIIFIAVVIIMSLSRVRKKWELAKRWLLEEIGEKNGIHTA